MLPRLTNPPLHRSIADIPEAELVGQLLANRLQRQAILNIRGMPNAPRVLQRVDLGDAPGGCRGDADILLFPPEQPQLATAIEVKRIKVGASAFKSDRPNKLQGYDEGVEQAHRLARVGFGQVYLYLFVVVDSRVQNDGRYTYDGLTSELRAVIKAGTPVENLMPRVGLIRHEFVQPMDYAPLTLGTYGGELERLATPCVQPSSLTE